MVVQEFADLPRCRCERPNDAQGVRDVLMHAGAVGPECATNRCPRIGRRIRPGCSTPVRIGGRPRRAGVLGVEVLDDERVDPQPVGGLTVDEPRVPRQSVQDLVGVAPPAEESRSCGRNQSTVADRREQVAVRGGQGGRHLPTRQSATGGRPAAIRSRKLPGSAWSRRAALTSRTLAGLPSVTACTSATCASSRRSPPRRNLAEVSSAKTSADRRGPRAGVLRTAARRERTGQHGE